MLGFCFNFAMADAKIFEDRIRSESFELLSRLNSLKGLHMGDYREEYFRGY